MSRAENLQKTARTLAKLSAGFLAGYSANIEYSARYDSPLRRLVTWRATTSDADARKALEKIGNKFFINSIDEMIKDSLRTGDVVVFSKKWYYCHLHAIFFRYIYRQTTSSDFDHFGIIIQDKGGEPYVLESNAFGGYKLHRYDERIFLAKSNRIGVYPLLPRDDEGEEVFGAAEKGGVRGYVESVVLRGGDQQHDAAHDADGVCLNHNYNMVTFLLMRSLGAGRSTVDPTLLLLSGVYRRLGLRLVGGSDSSMKALLGNKIAIAATDEGEGTPGKQKRRAFRFGDIIKIKE